MGPAMTDAFPIEGWASIYNEPDLNGDIIAPGAFRKSIAKGGVKLLYQHTVEQPVGRWLAFEERAAGLYARGELFLATQTAREVAELVRAGIIDGLSIGYQTTKSRADGPNRRILEADLWEVSIVTFPMAPKARLTAFGRAPKGDAEIALFAENVREAARILSAQPYPPNPIQSA